MMSVVEGQRYWKHGDHSHVWIVDAVIHDRAERAPFAVLVSEAGDRVEDVDLSHLADPNLYVLVPSPPDRP